MTTHLSYRAVARDGRSVVGATDKPTSPRDLAQQLVAVGYVQASIRDGYDAVAGVDTVDGETTWWVL